MEEESNEDEAGSDVDSLSDLYPGSQKEAINCNVFVISSHIISYIHVNFPRKGQWTSDITLKLLELFFK